MPKKEGFGIVRHHEANFKVDSTDFPSLGEIQQQLKTLTQNSAHVSSSYSDKLKAASVESKSHAHYIPPKSVSVNPRGASTSTSASSPNPWRKVERQSKRNQHDSHHKKLLSDQERISWGKTKSDIRSADHKTNASAQKTSDSRTYHMKEYGNKQLTMESPTKSAPGPFNTKSSVDKGRINNSASKNSYQVKTNQPNDSNQENVVTEAKFKTKRKSKVKRLAALQSGKISVLSAEVHTRILAQSNSYSSSRKTNASVNIDDAEEYPELGMAVTVKPSPKIEMVKVLSEASLKNSPNEQTSVRETISSISDVNTVICSNDQDLLDSSENLENETANDNDVPERSVHSKDKINLPLFDMVKIAKKSKIKDLDHKPGPDGNTLKDNQRTKMQAVNLLDSSRPVIKRGKERETPKTKRPSHLKKIILMDRKLRKQNRSLSETDCQAEMNQLEAEDSEKHSSDVEESSSNYQHELNSDVKYNSIEVIHSPSSGWEDDDTSSLENCVFLKDEVIHTQENIATISNDSNKESDNIIERNVNDSVSETGDTTGPSSKYDLCKQEHTEDQSNIFSDHTEPHYSSDSSLSINQNNNEQISGLSNENDSFNVDNSNIVKVENSEVRTNLEICEAKLDDISTNVNREESKCNMIESESDESCLDTLNKMRIQAVNILIHTKKFREYCNHFTSKEIDLAVESLLNDLVRFQDRMHLKNPVKAKVKRRLIYGIKEIKKHMKLKKLKCIIVAADIENVSAEGGLNDLLEELKSLSEAYHIPCLFSHQRLQLGRLCHKPVAISCVGIFNYEGSEKNFKEIIELHNQSKQDYTEFIKILGPKLSVNQIEELIKVRTEAPEKLYDLRISILREHVIFQTKIEENPENEAEVSDKCIIHKTYNFVKL